MAFQPTTSQQVDSLSDKLHVMQAVLLSTFTQVLSILALKLDLCISICLLLYAPLHSEGNVVLHYIYLTSY